MTTREDLSKAQAKAPGATEAQEVSLPVVEEELQVGKREVERGGVRVQTHVTERPVEEQVRLREEQVTVERHPVDRAVSATDARAFKEGVFEVRQRGEEVVVAKEARVVEDVIISKTVGERTETVRDTVRRTDVEVEQLGARQGHEAYDADFRKHYDTSAAKTGAPYDQYAPAYQYGHTLASDQRYQGRDWSDVEDDAQRSWEGRSPGTWERFKESVRYGWERVRQALS